MNEEPGRTSSAAVLRVAVFGNGFARQHLSWLAELPQVRVGALCYRSDEDAARATARDFGIDLVTTDAERVWADRPEVSCIVTPVATHAALVRGALASGGSVVCDKPLGLTLREAEELAKAAVGTPSMVMFQWRFHPALEALRALVLDGGLGPLTDADASFDHDFLASPAAVSAWRHDPAVAGAGALADQGVHLFDQLSWITGAGYRVSAATARVVHPVRQGAGEPVSCRTEDVAVVLLESGPDGPVGQVRVSRVSGGLRRIRIGVRGTRACAEVEIDPEDASAVLRVSGTPPRVWPAGSLANPYERFLRARSGEAVELPTFEDAARAQALLDSAVARLREA